MSSHHHLFIALFSLAAHLAALECHQFLNREPGLELVRENVPEDVLKTLASINADYAKVADSHRMALKAKAERLGKLIDISDWMSVNHCDRSHFNKMSSLLEANDEPEEIKEFVRFYRIKTLETCADRFGGQFGIGINWFGSEKHHAIEALREKVEAAREKLPANSDELMVLANGIYSHIKSGDASLIRTANAIEKKSQKLYNRLMLNEVFEPCRQLLVATARVNFMADPELIQQASDVVKKWMGYQTLCKSIIDKESQILENVFEKVKTNYSVSGKIKSVFCKKSPPVID